MSPYPPQRAQHMLNKTVEGLASWFSLTDEQAMVRARTAADLHAYGLLVERWRKRIYNLCLRMTGSTHTAEDLTQEVFVRIFDRRQVYDPTKRFSTWLWRIALNLCYDELRRVQRRHELSLDDEAANNGCCVRLEVIDPSTPQAQLQQREEGVPYLLNEADPETKKRLAAHLNACPQCAGDVHGWRMSLQRLDAWKVGEMPRRGRPVVSPAFTLAAAAVLVLGLGFLGGR